MSSYAMLLLALVVSTLVSGATASPSVPRHQSWEEEDSFLEDSEGRDSLRSTASHTRQTTLRRRLPRGTRHQPQDSHHVSSETSHQSQDSHHVSPEASHQSQDSRHVSPETTRQSQGSHPVSPTRRSYTDSNPLPDSYTSLKRRRRASGESVDESDGDDGHSHGQQSADTVDGEHLVLNIFLPPAHASDKRLPAHTSDKRLHTAARHGLGERALCAWHVREDTDEARVPRTLSQAVLEETYMCEVWGGRCEAVTYSMTVSHHLPTGLATRSRVPVTVAHVCVMMQHTSARH